MSAKVELVHNPYRKNLRVLIDGQPVSAYSNLQQFTGEPFLYWCDRILGAIFDECNHDPFVLHVTARREEASILETLTRDDPRCTQFVSHRLVRDTSLTERMRELNTILKQTRSTGYQTYRKKILFLLPEGLAGLRDDLESMEVRNHFCQLDAQVTEYAAYSRQPVAADTVFLLCLPGQGEKASQKLGLHSGFVIEVGEDTGFYQKREELLFYRAGNEQLFPCIFECLQLGCLMDVFCDCVGSLSRNVRQANAEALERLTSIEGGIRPQTECTTIELGRSVPVHFTSDLEDGSVDICQLRFGYSEEGIIHCNGMRVEGLRPGTASLQIYKQGAWEPCASVAYTVVKRSRIQSLTLDAEELTLGEGDSQTLEVSYLPENADNADKIEWTSDDESIAVVDSQGLVTGVKPGQCIIRCIAERVCAECGCVVQAHLQKLETDVQSLELCYGEEYTFTVRCVPEDGCVDAEIRCSSLDMQIANVLGHTIKAVGYGDTRVVIQNREETVRTEIQVSVLTPQQLRQREKEQRRAKRKAKGFFGGLFG